MTFRSESAFSETPEIERYKQFVRDRALTFERRHSNDNPIAKRLKAIASEIEDNPDEERVMDLIGEATDLLLGSAED
jgi:hypothetical protein